MSHRATSANTRESRGGIVSKGAGSAGEKLQPQNETIISTLPLRPASPAFSLSSDSNKAPRDECNRAANYAAPVITRRNRASVTHQNRCALRTV